MKRFLIRSLFVSLFLAIIGIQFVEIDRTNPPVKEDLNAPSEVKNILRYACYDCHSSETKWPWYSKVAPISWFIVDDVEEGRSHLNFSEWESLDMAKRRELKNKIIDEIKDDDMPLKSYTYLHPGASLNLSQKSILNKWLRSVDY